MATKNKTKTEAKDENQPTPSVLSKIEGLDGQYKELEQEFNAEAEATLDSWMKVYKKISVSTAVKTRLRKLLGDDVSSDSKESKPRTKARTKDEKLTILKPFFTGKDKGSKFLLSELKTIVPAEWEIPKSTSPSVLFDGILTDFATKTKEKDGLAFYWTVN
jgi:hypothetical protein